MIPLCRTSEVPADGGLRVELAGRAPVAVFRVGTQYFVIDDTCTHGNASLSEGEVDGEEIACPFHFGKFNLRSGEATAPPCVEPVRAYAVEIHDGYVFAAFSDESLVTLCTGSPAWTL